MTFLKSAMWASNSDLLTQMELGEPGEMEACIEEWGRLIALLRRRLGFEIVGARTTEADRFVR